MNCPSRVDADAVRNGWNQSPHPLALHTNRDLNSIANRRSLRDHQLQQEQLLDADPVVEKPRLETNTVKGYQADPVLSPASICPCGSQSTTQSECGDNVSKGDIKEGGLVMHSSVQQSPVCVKQYFGAIFNRLLDSLPAPLQGFCKVIKKSIRFLGPGFMISVAYIDPGNYATDVAAGATYRYKLLVMVLVSNLIAIFLQSLCIRLGSVTGLNLAENIKANTPWWLNYILYFFAEAAIIATDMAEVIGTAIALNLLLKIPVVAGCAISIVDVLLILLFYRPSGSMRGMRIFEFFVAALVLGVVICFSIELSFVDITSIADLFKGYLPSSTLVQGQGLYQSCGILGATVMPHSLYLGSGIVQPRLREYDQTHHNLRDDPADEHAEKYRPSLAAIRSCMNYSILELAIALFTFALFVNSAILIVSGASLADTPGAADADLFGIHKLLSTSLAPAAGTVFALALLLSGTSAGIVCTIAGQMVSEGQLSLSMKPWLMRLMTRSLSITPSIIVAGAVGTQGLSEALVASQVALSVILPFTSAPLIYFTCRNKFMTVSDSSAPEGVKMRNSLPVACLGVLLWLLIAVMNIALLVLLALGVG